MYFGVWTLFYLDRKSFYFSPETRAHLQRRYFLLNMLENITSSGHACDRISLFVYIYIYIYIYIYVCVCVMCVCVCVCIPSLPMMAPPAPQTQ